MKYLQGTEETVARIVATYIDDYDVQSATIWGVGFLIDNDMPEGNILEVNDDGHRK